MDENDLQNKDKHTTNRRNFLKTAVASAAASAMLPLMAESADAQAASRERHELDELTVEKLRQGIESHNFSPSLLTQMYLSRIDELDRRGPRLNSVIEVNPEAFEIADALEREHREKGARGPLYGIPVLIKDNIGTADKMQTTAGSLALIDARPAKDSFVAARLRASGAVILGKTNLSEWANIRSNYSTSGWSGRGGLTLNPYVLDRNPSGSSSGSAVAVATSLCAAAVGTETDGSIVSPASCCGIVGLKPTVGLVSRAGIVPIAHSQDTAGPMGRTVADVAALLSAMVGIDSDDSATAAASSKLQSDYTQFLLASGLRGARIGVVRKYAGFSDAVDNLFAEALAAMKSAGAEIIDPVEIPTIGKFTDAEMEVLLYELKDDLNKYLAGLGPKAAVHSLQDVIAFNEKHRREEMPYFGQDLFIQAQAKGPLTSKDYLKALEQCRTMSRKDGIDAVMTKHKFDALVAPTNCPACVTDLVDGDRSPGGSSSLAAVAGYPDITVPMGFVFGLPVGVSFFGRAWSEPTLIKLAYSYEQATRLRKPPKFLATADLKIH